MHKLASAGNVVRNLVDGLAREGVTPTGLNELGRSVTGARVFEYFRVSSRMCSQFFSVPYQQPHRARAVESDQFSRLTNFSRADL